jgi:ABC-type multidrug transport system fused ATPase/permease subunit
MSREVENDIRHDFFAHLQKLPKSFYNKRTTGDIMAHATNDIGNVRNFIGPGIMYSVQTVTRIVFSLIILFNINPTVTILALAPLPLFTYIVYKVGKATFNRSLRVYEIFSNLTSKAQECLSGIRVIKSYAREKNESEEFDEISLDYQKKNLMLAKVQSFSFPDDVPSYEFVNDHCNLFRRQGSDERKNDDRKHFLIPDISGAADMADDSIRLDNKSGAACCSIHEQNNGHHQN